MELARHRNAMPTQTDQGFEQRIAAVRRFNRFYTQRIGVLREHLLDSAFSLTGSRVLYELAHWPARGDPPNATVLAGRLALDAGYLSRILRAFEQQGLVRKQRSVADGRRKALRLTGRGRRQFAQLDARSQAEIGTMLAQLSAAGQARLVAAMQAVGGLLGAAPGGERAPEPYVLRPPQPGDMGWVIHRHGALYAREYGYDQRFEALVAEVVAQFVQRFDAARERCWIAERQGEIVGSVFLVRKTKTVAKLRLLLVEPRARGLGIGRRLIDECIGFARAAAYQKLTLWTQSELDAARHLYAQAGLRQVGEEPHASFGKQLVAETWELAL
ncbi:MAG TPA: helix-turn-helix domain-containing GNAT family N-acetyltransferase [Casimicrobiaceae bacterium]|jgi:DNA-binding MarR family transcriptional regulator/N-acetylglutamate synthase-like GNAT family acetyltransferase|nr:helix-turn-helix domain-containing GNAT family N-acetyltransferase [Casimicrobiaceae bacterium]